MEPPVIIGFAAGILTMVAKISCFGVLHYAYLKVRSRNMPACDDSYVSLSLAVYTMILILTIAFGFDTLTLVLAKRKNLNHSVAFAVGLVVNAPWYIWANILRQNISCHGWSSKIFDNVFFAAWALYSLFLALYLSRSGRKCLCIALGSSLLGMGMLGILLSQWRRYIPLFVASVGSDVLALPVASILWPLRDLPEGGFWTRTARRIGTFLGTNRALRVALLILLLLWSLLCTLWGFRPKAVGDKNQYLGSMGVAMLIIHLTVWAVLKPWRCPRRRNEEDDIDFETNVIAGVSHQDVSPRHLQQPPSTPHTSPVPVNELLATVEGSCVICFNYAPIMAIGCCATSNSVKGMCVACASQLVGKPCPFCRMNLVLKEPTPAEANLMMATSIMITAPRIDILPNPPPTVPPRPSPQIRGVAAQAATEVPAEARQRCNYVPYTSLTFLEEIGQGSFGKVYRGMFDNRIVAIKEMSGSDQSTPQIFAELEIQIQLRHENVVEILAISSNATSLPIKFYIIMPLAEGGSLASHLSCRECSLGSLCPGENHYRVAVVLTSCLQFLHTRHAVHGDIKPQNILLNRDGKPLIADFGIAQFGEHTAQGYTPFYQAPEWSFGPIRGTEKTDIFAMGLTFLQLILRCRIEFARQAVHEPDRLAILLRNANPKLRTAVMGMLDLDPSRRFTAADASRELQ